MDRKCWTSPFMKNDHTGAMTPLVKTTTTEPAAAPRPIAAAAAVKFALFNCMTLL